MVVNGVDGGSGVDGTFTDATFGTIGANDERGMLLYVPINKYAIKITTEITTSNKRA